MRRSRHPLTLRRLLAVTVLLAALTVGLPAAAQPDGDPHERVFDGDPATTERIDQADPVQAAIEVSRVRFDDAGTPGGRLARHVVLATTAAFADSLAGAALSTDGPLLLTAQQALDPGIAAEIDRVLGGEGVAYVLGGESALAPAVADALSGAGYTVTRLAGETRVETAVAVATELRNLHGGDTVLLARSDAPPDNPTAAWADSMTGGALAAAAGVPIVVTPTASLHPAVAAWLDADAPARTILLGGEAALSRAVADSLRAAAAGARGMPERVAGPERTATAAAMAERLWDELVGVDRLRRFVIMNAGASDGWMFGLAAAGLAADASAPPLTIVSGALTAPTRRLVSTCGAADVDLLLVGDRSVVSAVTEATLTSLDGDACASVFASLSPFDDCVLALDYFVAEGLDRVGPYGLDGYWYGAVEPLPVGADGGVEEGGEPPADPVAAPAPSAPDGDAAGEGGGDEGRETSDTNVQEVGVDEPDIVKTDGAAAYVVARGQVQVVDLTDLDQPRLSARLDVADLGFSHELLLHEDVLIVLSRGDGFVVPGGMPPADTAFAPEPYFPEPVTTLTRYDISNPLQPQQLDRLEIDGSYRSARMIDGVVRVVTSANPSGLPFVIPADGSPEASSAALAHNRQVITNSTIRDWLPGLRHDADQDGGLAVDCADVYAPPDFSGITTVSVIGIDVADSLQPTSSAAVVAQGETIYASTERLVVTSSRWGEWRDEELPPTVTTEVHSFDIAAPAETRYVASGQVDGYVLNQFALSERDGYYRIATTTEPPWLPFVDGPAIEEGAPPPAQLQQAQDTTDNGVTILTEGGGELFEVGRVFGLGLGERIFAVRYIGDIAAVVTFRQVDPLYLLDLTNPAAPRVTGELKIPGVSRYLHPLGGDHLLGVGQDGTDDGRLIGLQVSLFDISDRSAPTQADAITYGPGNSPVEFDHKAFLLWAPLGRAFVPAELYEQGFSGVKAVDLDLTGNMLLDAGSLVQPDGAFAGVQRTVVVDDRVLTVSEDGVGAHDLLDLTALGFADFD